MIESIVVSAGLWSDEGFKLGVCEAEGKHDRFFVKAIVQHTQDICLPHLPFFVSSILFRQFFHDFAHFCLPLLILLEVIHALGHARVADQRGFFDEEVAQETAEAALVGVFHHSVDDVAAVAEQSVVFFAHGAVNVIQGPATVENVVFGDEDDAGVGQLGEVL